LINLLIDVLLSQIVLHFRKSVINAQRYVRGYLACTEGRLTALSKIWVHQERVYAVQVHEKKIASLVQQCADLIKGQKAALGKHEMIADGNIATAAQTGIASAAQKTAKHSAATVSAASTSAAVAVASDLRHCRTVKRNGPVMEYRDKGQKTNAKVDECGKCEVGGSQISIYVCLSLSVF
jgi:hypothetical protein